MMSPKLYCVFKCTINNLFQGYFNKLCDKMREDGDEGVGVGWNNRRNLHVWPSCNLSLQQMAGITVSFIIYSQWAPLTLMLTAAPGNGLLNSNTCSWLICLLSKGLGGPEAILYHDTPLNGGHTLGVGRFERRQWCSREALWGGGSVHGTSQWSFRAGVPRATPPWRNCGEDGLRTKCIPCGHCWHLIVPYKQAFTGGMIPVSLCFRPDRSPSAQSPGLTTEVQLGLC